jgi:hypothetical protein
MVHELEEIQYFAGFPFNLDSGGDLGEQRFELNPYPGSVPGRV